MFGKSSYGLREHSPRQWWGPTFPAKLPREVDASFSIPISRLLYHKTCLRGRTEDNYMIDWMGRRKLFCFCPWSLNASFLHSLKEFPWLSNFFIDAQKSKPLCCSWFWSWFQILQIMNGLAPGHTSLPSGRHHARRGMSTIMKTENQSDSYRPLNGCFECDPTAKYMLA